MAVETLNIHWQGYQQDVNERWWQSEHIKDFDGFHPGNDRGESGRDKLLYH